VRVPSQEAAKEDWSKFHDKLFERAPHLTIRPDNEEQQAEFNRLRGVPVDPDGYVKPEGVELPEGTHGELSRISNRLSLSNKQHHELINVMGEYTAQQAKAAEDFQNQQQEELKGILGEAHDDHVKVANQIAAEYQNEKLPVDNLPPAVVLMLTNLAKAMKGEKQSFQIPLTPDPGLTKDEHLNKAREINEELRKPLTRADRDRLLRTKAEHLKQGYA
jgi:hypothetical protein